MDKVAMISGFGWGLGGHRRRVRRQKRRRGLKPIRSKKALRRCLAAAKGKSGRGRCLGRFARGRKR